MVTQKSLDGRADALKTGVGVEQVPVLQQTLWRVGRGMAQGAPSCCAPLAAAVSTVRCCPAPGASPTLPSLPPSHGWGAVGGRLGNQPASVKEQNRAEGHEPRKPGNCGYVAHNESLSSPSPFLPGHTPAVKLPTLCVRKIQLH